MKIALITGITGQDGSYLAELLLEKGYIVYGLCRYVSDRGNYEISRLKKIIKNNNFKLIYGDITDSSNITRIIKETMPDEIYNLAGLSHVKVTFDSPEYTANANGLGALRILEAIRILGLENKTRFYQASTSELFGKTQNFPQTEKTPFSPCSPYACAKLYAYWITVIYRESYNIFAVNGILFNHESKRRGKDFVMRKITSSAARIKLGLQKKLYLGNLSAERDFGCAKDYVIGMWKMLQQSTPKDYILASQNSISIRELCKLIFKELEIEIEFTGYGINEIGRDKKTGKEIILVDPKLFRPNDVQKLVGDSSMAKKELDWKPEYDINKLIKEMIDEDLKQASNE